MLAYMEARWYALPPDEEASLAVYSARGTSVDILFMLSGSQSLMQGT